MQQCYNDTLSNFCSGRDKNYLPGVPLRGVKNKRNFQTISSKSGRGRLRGVVAKGGWTAIKWSCHVKQLNIGVYVWEIPEGLTQLLRELSRGLVAMVSFTLLSNRLDTKGT